MNWRHWIGWILLILVLLSAYGLVVFNFSSNASNRAAFGEMFGAISALFTALAFIGLLATLRQQQEQIFRTQEAFEMQSFETMFFNLLNIHNQLLDSMVISAASETYAGRAVFQFLLRQFTGFYGEVCKSIQGGEDRTREEGERIQETYRRVIQYHGYQFGHYFRSLYNIIKFVDVSDVPNARQYTNVVRAQMSGEELLMLFYNCLGDEGREKFKPLVEKYALLKSFPKDQLLNADQKGNYPLAAYGE